MTPDRITHRAYVEAGIMPLDEYVREYSKPDGEELSEEKTIMKLYYLDTMMGCGIRSAESLEQARANGLREVGTHNFKSVREVTDQEIAAVRAMGGYIPKARS